MNQVTVKSVNAGLYIRYAVYNAKGEKVKTFGLKTEAEAYAEKLRREQ
jgi:hypothetical protein